MVLYTRVVAVLFSAVPTVLWARNVRFTLNYFVVLTLSYHLAPQILNLTTGIIMQPIGKRSLRFTLLFYQKVISFTVL